jgi:hypothetical protein
MRPGVGHTRGMDKPRLPALDSVARASEPATPSRLYHAAPAAERASILAAGIDPERFPRERWDASDIGVWCFDTSARACYYATSRSQGPLPEPYDVWEVDAAGLEATRPLFDPELNSGVDVWYLAAAVPADRVRRLSELEVAAEAAFEL